MAEAQEVTQILGRMRAGDPQAAEQLLPLLQAELRRLAERAMAGQRPDHTLQPTALLHEAWIRVAGAPGEVHGREHFLALAATAMRSVLVDHARRRRAEKRGGGAGRESLDGIVIEWEDRALDLVALDDALEQLGGLDPALVRVVELRFFAGLAHPAIAEAEGRSLRSVERDWAVARDWLRQRLEPAMG
ncbi:MAG: ECF-type sigma factor [Planctomycetota bacterium]